MHVTATNVFH